MSATSARDWLARHAPELHVIDNGASTATVLEAAAALGVMPARIAKTLALRVGQEALLVVARGDARLDNALCKTRFGDRPRMLGADEMEALTGHRVGGVCPFGLATPMPVWLDRSLAAFPTVFPAAGSRTSSVQVAPARLLELVGQGWVEVCRVPDETG